MNAKNTLGARLGKKFINLEPDSVRPFFPNTLYYEYTRFPNAVPF